MVPACIHIGVETFSPKVLSTQIDILIRSRVKPLKKDSFQEINDFTGKGILENLSKCLTKKYKYTFSSIISTQNLYHTLQALKRIWIKLQNDM